MRRSVVLLIVVALVAASSVTTWVVAGAATKGKISGCVDDETGEIDQMRFGKTPKGGECDEGETAFTWNVRGQRGPIGPEGPQGPQGPPGAAGAVIPSVSGWEIIQTTGTAGPWSNSAKDTTCTAGKKAVGGGTEIIHNQGGPVTLGQVFIDENHPLADGSGWHGRAYTPGGAATAGLWSLRVYVICVTP